MIILIALALITAVAVSISIYVSQAHVAVKYTALAALLCLCVFAYDIYVRSMGAPINAIPEGEYGYVHHIISDDHIYLWVVADQDQHRLYRFPYDRETAQTLQQAGDLGQGGHPPSDIKLDFVRSDSINPDLRIIDLPFEFPSK